MQTQRNARRAQLWVPALARARELVSVWCSRTGATSPTAIAKALGLTVRHVRRLIAAGLPELTYARGWVPIAWHLLADARFSVPAKILATVAPQLGMGKRAARRLGWPLSRVRHARRALQRAAFNISAGRTKEPPLPGQNDSPLIRAHLSPSVHSTGTDVPSIRRARAEQDDTRSRRSTATAAASADGWSETLTSESRGALAGGRNAASVALVLRRLGFFERSDAARATYASELTKRGLTVEHLLALVAVLVTPPRSLGRVRSRAGTLRTWLDHGGAPEVQPLAVGRKAIAAAQRAAATAAAEVAARAKLVESVERARTELGGARAAVGEILAGCGLGERFRDASMLLADLGGSVAALAVVVVRFGVQETACAMLPQSLQDRFRRAMLATR